MAGLNIQGVAKSFGSATALSDVTLDIQSGEFVCLLGESGCGKTTLLRQIAGLDTPDTGSILLDGNDLVAVPCHERNIGMVFQSLALFPHLNVLQNVAYALEIKGTDRASRTRRAEELLKTVGLGIFFLGPLVLMLVVNFFERDPMAFFNPAFQFENYRNSAQSV